MKKLIVAFVAGFMSMALASAYAADKGDAKSDTGAAKSEKGMAKSADAKTKDDDKKKKKDDKTPSSK
ncbi:MAG TPA: hypothetical protein VFI62_09410 [Burkholderiales bacterium]|nr:hypothetical protein [Burkholderiales bacterium]